MTAPWLITESDAEPREQHAVRQMLDVIIRRCPAGTPDDHVVMLLAREGYSIDELKRLLPQADALLTSIERKAGLR